MFKISIYFCQQRLSKQLIQQKLQNMEAQNQKKSLVEQQQSNEINYDKQNIDNSLYRDSQYMEKHSRNGQTQQKNKEDDNSYPNPHFREQNKYMTSHTDKNSHKKYKKGKKIALNENQQLKMKNEALKRQLLKFQKRLDAEISKRSQKTQMKNDLLNSMELQNAYRRCEIYKKQIKLIKKRDLSLSQDKYNQMKGQLEDKIRQNQQLKNQVKQLTKIGKFQQKGLIQLGNSNYITTITQNQRLKNENNKMKQKLQQNQRNNRLVPLAEKNQKNKKQQKQAETTKQIQQEQKKQQKQLDLLKSTHEKDTNKLRQLTFEKNRQLETIQNLTAKLQQKDKQIIGLKGTILKLRRINKQSTKQKRSHTEATSKEPHQSKLNSSHSKRSQFIIKRRILNKNQEKSSVNSRQQNRFQKQSQKQSQKNSQQIKNGEIFLTDNPEGKTKQSQGQEKNRAKYPRLEEFGKRKQHSEQWNDHPFRSKIKEIQILSHQKGYIKDIHIRYQNGEPNKKQGQYSSFVCQEFNQYITSISGGFKDEILQYLVIETNSKRINKFCRYDIAGQCQQFMFQIGANQYPSALFGEKINDGIIRIGCFIDQVQKK